MNIFPHFIYYLSGIQVKTTFDKIYTNLYKSQAYTNNAQFLKQLAPILVLKIKDWIIISTNVSRMTYMPLNDENVRLKDCSDQIESLLIIEILFAPLKRKLEERESWCPTYLFKIYWHKFSNFDCHPLQKYGTICTENKVQYIINNKLKNNWIFNCH